MWRARPLEWVGRPARGSGEASRGRCDGAGMSKRRLLAVSLLVVLHASFALAAVPVDDDGKLAFTVYDFDDNYTGDAHFNFDKWYLKAQRGNGWVWAGRYGLGAFWLAGRLAWERPPSQPIEQP